MDLKEKVICCCFVYLNEETEKSSSKKNFCVYMCVSDDKMAIFLKGRGKKEREKRVGIENFKESSNLKLQRHPLLELLGFPCSHESVSHSVVSDSLGSHGL